MYVSHEYMGAVDFSIEFSIGVIWVDMGDIFDEI